MSDCAGAWTISSCSEGLRADGDRAHWSRSRSTLLATVTPTSNWSPGATKVGTPGVMTNGPRMSDSVSVEPTASGGHRDGHDLQVAAEVIGHIVSHLALRGVRIDDARPKDHRLVRDPAEGIELARLAVAASGGGAEDGELRQDQVDDLRGLTESACFWKK